MHRSKSLALISSLVTLPLIGGGALSRESAPQAHLAALDGLVLDALREGTATSESAIAALRAEGPRGLEAVLLHADLRTDGLQEGGLEAVADRVGGQRGALYDNLFWYTDLDEARAEAARSNKPILSLRMLGRLTEEYSCANSRFFRAALYSNPEVADFMRERFVLHWSRERPAPKITIDMGNGDQITRTITGNSAHYVLDTSGAPLDIIPGLYGPGAFLAELTDAAALAAALQDMDGHDLPRTLRDHHATRHDEATRALADRLSALRGMATPLSPDAIAAWLEAGGDDDGLLIVPAIEAQPLTVSKMAIEAPILRGFDPRRAVTDLAAPTNAEWAQLAQSWLDDSRLHPTSVARIHAEEPLGPRQWIDGARAEETFPRMIERFEADMAQDTAINELVLHAQVHAWFADGAGEMSFADLNRLVYARLFKTPWSDPWLGLVDELAYTGLDQAGRHHAR